jgi:pilus assembly protein CpaB
MNLRALLFSLAVGGLTVVLLVLYLRRLEVDTSGGSPIAVIAVVKPIEPGTVLTAEMLSIKAIPQAYVESRAVLKSDMSKVIGLKVDTLVKAQQTLMWTDLAITSDDRRQLSLLVQPGMRAVGIRATHDDKHFALIRPGDRVDVYASLPGVNASMTDRDRTSVIVVQNVIVLAVGLDTGAQSVTGNPRQPTRDDLVLTLSVNPQQLQLLSLAGDRGRLSVGLRNPNDTRLLEGVAELPSSVLTAPQQEKRTAAAPVSAKPLHLKENSGPSTAPVRAD